MAFKWCIPIKTLPTLKEKESLGQPTLHKHYCNLKVHDEPINELQTGIMCDIGMGNRDAAVIQRLIACGMTIARLDLMNLEPDASTQLVQSVRQAVYNYSADLKYIYPLAVLVDVRGPDIITGDLKNGYQATIEIFQNETIKLTTELNWKECGTPECLYVDYEYLTHLVPNDIIFIDSIKPGEKVKLSVVKVGEDSVECYVNSGGIIGSKMAVTISRVPANHDSVDSKSKSPSIICSDTSINQLIHIDEQIAWAVASDIDAILVPCAQTSHDVKQAKEILSRNGRHILVFAGINTVLGLDNIDDILKEADGIYLDRNELSTDLPVEKIFIAQKMIVSKCNDLGKPSICKSVVNEQIPTLCVNDIANLVIDGVDVISLEFNYDSPLKKLKSSYDPYRTAEHCLAAASVICREAENMLWRPRIYGNLELMQSPINEPSKVVCVSAVELAMRSRASIILCLTNSGRTARILAYIRPPCPVVAVTRTCHAGRQLRFWRGVRVVHYLDIAKTSWHLEQEARIMAAIDYCKAKQILNTGDPYVIVTGSRRGVGYCDSVRLLYASGRNTVEAD